MVCVEGTQMLFIMDNSNEKRIGKSLSAMYTSLKGYYITYGISYLHGLLKRVKKFELESMYFITAISRHITCQFYNTISDF